MDILNYLDKPDAHVLENLIQDLRERIVLGFCGAGMSAQLGYPTWKDMIFSLLKHVEQTNYDSLPADLSLTILAGQFSVPTAAGKLKGLLKERDFFEFLDTTFSRKAGADYSYEHDCLVQMPIRLWLTTNYDLCLLDALAANLRQNICPRRRIPIEALLRSDQTMPQVIHLHGIVTEPEDIILTDEDYKKAYFRDASLSESIRALGPLKLLFIGYGLGDNELNHYLQMIDTRLGTSASLHYALLPKTPHQRITDLDLRKRELHSYGVRPIFYPITGNDHSARLDLIKFILNKLDIATPRPHEEMKLWWAHEEISVSELRRELRELTKQAGISTTILRSCSFNDHFVSISFTNEIDRNRVNEAASISEFWFLNPPEFATVPKSRENILPRNTKPILLRDGKPFRTTMGKTLESSVISQEEIEPKNFDESAKELDNSPENLYRHLIHLDAYERVDPSQTQYRNVIETLMPKKVPFSLADIFSSVITWRLDSPIIHVWIYSKGGPDKVQIGEISAITAVGTGLEPVRHEFESSAYAAALSLPRDAIRVITRGFIHLSVPSSENEARVQPKLVSRVASQIFGRRQGTIIPEIPEGARESLSGLHTVIKRLADNCGLIEIHYENEDNLNNYREILFTRCFQAHKQSRPNIVKPRETTQALTFFPYSLLNTNMRIILLLSGDLLETSMFRKVMDTYYHKVLIRLRADLERRIEFWTGELETFRAQLEWYKSLSNLEKVKLPAVRTDRELDEDLAIEVRVREQLVPAAVYYSKSLPEFHIPRASKQLIKLGAERNSLETLVKDEQSPLWKLCLSRIFDCAIRQEQLCDDGRINSLFDSWCHQVGGMLNWEWKQLLQAHSVPCENIFKRTTFFSVDYNENKNLIEIHANAVIDSKRATVVIDKKRITMIVLDPLDHATIEFIGEPCAFQRGDIRNVTSFLNKLKNTENSLCEIIWDQLSDCTMQKLNQWDGAETEHIELIESLIKDLNKIIRGDALDELPSRIEVPAALKQWTALEPKGVEHVHLNRNLLEFAFATELNQMSLHLEQEMRELLDSGYSEHKIIKKLAQKIFEIPRMAEFLIDSTMRDIDPALGIGELKEKVWKLANSVSAGVRFIRLRNNLAYNTADEVLSQEEEHPPAGKLLLIAAKMCQEEELDHIATFKSLLDKRTTGVPRRIVDIFNQAIEGDRALVERFVYHGSISPDKIKLTPVMKVAWDIEHSLEASLLAFTFRQAADHLDITGETQATAFLKCEEAFETAHMARFAHSPLSVNRVQQILTGAPLESK